MLENNIEDVVNVWIDYQLEQRLYTKVLDSEPREQKCKDCISYLESGYELFSLDTKKGTILRIEGKGEGKLEDGNYFPLIFQSMLRLYELSSSDRGYLLLPKKEKEVKILNEAIEEKIVAFVSASIVSEIGDIYKEKRASAREGKGKPYFLKYPCLGGSIRSIELGKEIEKLSESLLKNLGEGFSDFYINFINAYTKKSFRATIFPTKGVGAKNNFYYDIKKSEPGWYAFHFLVKKIEENQSKILEKAGTDGLCFADGTGETTKVEVDLREKPKVGGVFFPSLGGGVAFVSRLRVPVPLCKILPTLGTLPRPKSLDRDSLEVEKSKSPSLVRAKVRIKYYVFFKRDSKAKGKEEFSLTIKIASVVDDVNVVDDVRNIERENNLHLKDEKSRLEVDLLIKIPIVGEMDMVLFKEAIKLSERIGLRNSLSIVV